MRAVGKEDVLYIKITGLFINGLRYTVHTGDCGLAQTTGVCIQVELFFYIRIHCMFGILHASFFIVSLFAERFHRATLYADPAAAVTVVKAIGMMIGVWPFRDRKSDSRNDGAHPDCLAHRCDQSVAESECAEAGGIGCMPFRPV